MHPFGINPKRSEIKAAIKAARRAYKPLPETTCDHRAICCKAGCPNMYYAEFLSIYQGHVERLTPDERLNLTIDCVRRYLQSQVVKEPKPCVFLGEGNLCKTYDYRPLKCRLYGLIPSSMYATNVDNLSKEMGVPKEDIPLCCQCDRVKIKPEYAEKYADGKIPAEMIQELERNMRLNDRAMGMPKRIQDAGFGYLTYHDWHVMFELGEKWMESLSKLRVSLSDDQKEQFLVTLRGALGRREE